MKLYIIILIYLIIINVISLIVMGIDKKRAINGKWRISERNLFLYAIIGGSIGSIAGMKIFHHKTKHKQFIYGMPILLLLQIILGFLIFFRITHFSF
ncbi:MAG: hypothetical protein K0S61_1154 [Anaerocolumna sp.]|jgi:uncharacterized membrane protein YsdA (DUF1294 family)|nr:hypothetical protein [Anaerocolumna sp.]